MGNSNDGAGGATPTSGGTDGHTTAERRPMDATLLAKLFADVRDSITVVDAQARTIWTSAMLHSDLGYGPAFWERASLLDLVHPDERVAMERRVAELLERPGGRSEGEVRLRRPDGTWSHVNFSAVNRLDDTDVAGIVITARPIDSEVQSRRQRSEAERERREVAASQSSFIAQVSHEMRSPLHTILGLSELLTADDRLDEQQRRNVRTIASESDSLRAMIDDLLDFSKINAGRMELLHEPFSPAGVADSVVDGFTTRAASKGLDLTIAVDPAVPRAVLGDKNRVRQVLVNLVSNAVKYTERGSIDLALESLPEGWIRFAVTDTGPGIPDEAKDSLFDPYRQARTSDTIKGTGLGLAITRRLVDLMGGTLDFATSPSGTTFRCTVPFTEARRAEDLPAVSDAPVSGTGRILVCDDSEVNRMLAATQLERLGYESVTVPNAADALRTMATERFDAVLMDWHMPGMDGLEATRTWREREPADQHLPIITMTASAMSGDRDRCLAAGADDYLAKPVSITELGDKLSHWVASEAAPEEQPTAADEDPLDRLLAELGDPGVIGSIIDTYVGMLPQYVTSAVEGWETGDRTVVRRSVHTLSSTAALLGCDSFAETCRSIEADCLTDADLTQSLTDFEVEAADAERELVALRERVTELAHEPATSVRQDR